MKGLISYLGLLALALGPWGLAASSLPLPTKTIFQFDLIGSSIENVLARENGDLLFTLLNPSPQLYLLEGPATSKPKATLLHTFGLLQGLTGITETKPGTYVVGLGNVILQTGWSVWEVTLPQSTNKVTKVRKITDLPETKLINGVAAVPNSDVVLVADSYGGAVWRIDTPTGHSSKAFAYPQMAAQGLGTLGINGLKVRDGYMYFSNSVLMGIYRIQITADGYPAAGAAVETLVNLAGTAPFIDDFAIAADGTIWGATNKGNTVVAAKPVNAGDLSKYQAPVVVAGAPKQLTVGGDTAAAFGRGSADGATLYVCTSGALLNPVNLIGVEPGKIVAINTTGYQ